MRLIDKLSKVTRREVLAGGGAALVAASVSPGGMVTGKAWAAMPDVLQPATFGTLVQMSRDIYPHDRLADKYYATAVAALDKSAMGDATLKSLLEGGVADLDKAAKALHGTRYAEVAWEGKRVRLLRDIEATPFFQKLRGNLVVGLYNQKEVWAKFGYEGESASRGGYLNRGFDDATWIDQV